MANGFSDVEHAVKLAPTLFNCHYASLPQWYDDDIDLLCTDTPYSAKTHEGHNAAESNDGVERKQLAYASWGEAEVRMFVTFFRARVRGWWCVLTDHVLMGAWEAAFEEANLYPFAGIPVLIPGMTVRQSGDGHSREAVMLVAARPRERSFVERCRTLRGYYGPFGRDRWSKCHGSKPVAAMRRIIVDHSEPGDLVCDPCAGGGTTLYAAALDNRPSVGCEIDALTCRKAERALLRERRPWWTKDFNKDALASVGE